MKKRNIKIIKCGCGCNGYIYTIPVSRITPSIEKYFAEFAKDKRVGYCTPTQAIKNFGCLANTPVSKNQLELI